MCKYRALCFITSVSFIVTGIQGKLEVSVKVLVVYSHPNPESFNHAILEAVLEGLSEAGHASDVIDLYKMGFDPCLKVE
ncbi:MAG: NAD(P)H-dependent oxidoreductase, partial [Desulfobacteraceae bacterium]|nr:NAD(P)H-dependent oxidoreductase [Desulfobacteraceae bacterium]